MRLTISRTGSNAPAGCRRLDRALCSVEHRLLSTLRLPNLHSADYNEYRCPGFVLSRAMRQWRFLMTPIYLDHNATTPMLPEVIEAMAACHRKGYANPASQHQNGRRARQVLEDAREEVGRLLGADLTGRQPDKLIFTSGGTEANNLAIFGLAFAAGSHPGEAVVSTIEHPSVRGPIEQLERAGWLIHRLGVTRDGVVNVDKFAALINERTRFASVMLANNETGVIQPVSELAAIAAAAGVPLHTDAVQVVGKLPVDFHQLQVAALTLSAA